MGSRSTAGPARRCSRSWSWRACSSSSRTPPYCGVVEEDWDNQWETEAAFLAWLDGVLGLLRGILELRGSLYVFTSPQMLTRVDVAMRAQFHVLANITWQKPGANGQVDFEMLRTYWTRNNERIVFAEQRGEGLRPGAEEHRTRVEDELRGRIFEPIRAYLDGERARAGLSRGDVNRALNTNMAGHWFSSSQWALPTEAHYLRLRELFNAARAADGEPALDRDLALLQREADVLRREYNELKREYEALRRPFNLTKHDQWGEVWRFGGETDRQHPTQKPLPLIQQMVRVSSHKGDLVLDPFMGSGTTLRAAKELGRRVIGIEREEQFCAVAARRLAQEVLPL